MSGQALITSRYNLARGIVELDRKAGTLSQPSFPALQSQALSKQIVRVTDRRKGQAARVKRYRSSLSPCNSFVVRRLLRKNAALSCEPNWEIKLLNTPNDSMYSSIYAASNSSAGRINLPGAWELSTGSSSVVVGIIDTGIDYNHADLQANIWTNPGEIASNGVDDDGNGYIDDMHGIDAYNGDSNPFDDQSHGTHVAGTIGASGNNSIGVVGVNWNLKQVACKAFNASGTGTLSAVVTCLNYLVNLKNNFGVNIVATNNSYGGFPNSTAMYNSIAASRAANMVFVAGAGNYTSNNDNTPFYPASYTLDNVISVAANDSAGNIASFSNYGATSVDIAAPGVNILSTIPNNQYAFFNGTSMATPHVAGAVALLLSYHPEYTYAQAISAILTTARAVDSFSSKCVTGAILNVQAAMEHVVPTPLPTATPTPGAEPGNGDASPEEPGPSEPTLDSARLEISAQNSRTRSLVSCNLSNTNGDQSEALSGYTVRLAVKGASSKRHALTDQDGNVVFSLKPPRGQSLTVRCIAALTSSVAGEVVSVKSPFIKVRLSKRS